MQGGDALVRCLELEEVKYISGFSGGGLASLYSRLRASETIKVFSTRHERLGVEVADGYARATCQAAVVEVLIKPMPTPGLPEDWGL